MNARLKTAGASLFLLFAGTWAVTAAFAIKFPDFPFLLGPALAFVLFAGGDAALVAALYFAILACVGEGE